MRRGTMSTLLILLSLLSLNAENLYKVTLNSGEVYSCFIVEHRPGESLMIEDITDGSIKAFKDSDIYIIEKIFKRKPQVTKEDSVVSNKVTIIENSIGYRGYDSDTLNSLLNGLTYAELHSSLFSKELLINTDLNIKNEVFKDIRKNDHLKYTVMNIAPGVGSFKQGDYLSGLYTLLSVLGAVIYNVNDGFGTDYAMAVNLNMFIAYGASFFAPYNYNRQYNNRLETLMFN